MQTTQIRNWVRWVLVLCGIGLIIVLFVPMWNINLQAPQYPEGLQLLIYPNKLAGNVDIINGLNHYIGMKTLHTNDFFEFKILPYIIGVFAALFFLVAAVRKRNLLYLLLLLFICFGILAMYDFWRWEYNYGHNLNPEAAIVVPGMAYQPPLIGFKQLLNFGALSLPDIGGSIFIGVGLLLFFCAAFEWKQNKKNSKTVGLAAITILMISLSSCSAAPRPIVVGTDSCDYCKMTISDARFGGEILTKKGKTFKFDDMHCIIAFLKNKKVDNAAVKAIYFSNYGAPHELLLKDNAFLLSNELLKSPMNGNVAAFNNMDSLKAVQQKLAGTLVLWQDLIKQ